MGHPPAAVWQYTPRQIEGFLFIAARRQRAEKHDQLAMMAMAYRAKPEDLKKQLQELLK